MVALSLPCFSIFKLNIIFSKTWTLFSNNVNTTIRKHSPRAFVWVVTPLGFIGQFKMLNFCWFSEICFLSLNELRRSLEVVSFASWPCRNSNLSMRVLNGMFWMKGAWRCSCQSCVPSPLQVQHLCVTCLLGKSVHNFLQRQSNGCTKGSNEGLMPTSASVDTINLFYSLCQYRSTQFRNILTLIHIHIINSNIAYNMHVSSHYWNSSHSLQYTCS